MSASKGLQDVFLQELQASQVPVSIFLVNGVKLHGVIDNFDDDIILLKSTLTQIVYKHSVSTVVPAKLVDVGNKT
ncbi:MAG: RNA chaperone Hfq [Gammaproteobacteria bacterium]|nr:RNA chaperone Hfq [Gammaproteobacteria bacterium]